MLILKMLFLLSKIYVPVNTLSAKDKKNYQNFIEMDLNDQFTKTINKKGRMKARQMSIDIFSNQTL